MRTFRFLRSALFWRILVSSLVVVVVLGWALVRATVHDEQLQGQFERLVQHDLKLADHAEVLLRLTLDLETGKRGFILTGDRAFLEPYLGARRDLPHVLDEARAVAEPGAEDGLVAAFAGKLDEWSREVAEPQIRARASGEPHSQELAGRGRALIDQMRTSLERLRDDALAAAETRERLAFEAVAASRRATTTSIALAIVVALGTGLWIAHDTARAAALLREALAATGRLEPLPPLPLRRDELGEVGDALGVMHHLLQEKDASLRAMLGEREVALEEKTLAIERLRVQSAELARQGVELERANRVKTEFLATMSHELRTPLNAILGFADLLTRSPREALSPRARESLERIRRNGQHLLAIINDVLDLAKVEAGRVDIRPACVDLGQLARACVAEIDPLRSGDDVELTAEAPDEPVEVVTDPQRVRQILVNLLSNALKFTERGRVVLRVSPEADHVVLAVIDTGIGIPEQAMGELFRSFQQLDAGDGRRYEGTGIGLALSRRLARALGGDIAVSSTLGAGSTFALRLPRELPEAATARVAS